MINKRMPLVLSLCCLVALGILVFFLSYKQSYPPSVINKLCKVVTGIEFTAQIDKDDKQLMCTIINRNNYTISYDSIYYLEIEKEGVWYEIPDIRGKTANENNWDALGYKLKMNEQSQFTIDLNNYRALAKGNYRIVKFVNLEDMHSKSKIIIANVQII